MNFSGLYRDVFLIIINWTCFPLFCIKVETLTEELRILNSEVIFNRGINATTFQDSLIILSDWDLNFMFTLVYFSVLYYSCSVYISFIFYFPLCFPTSFWVDITTNLNGKLILQIFIRKANVYSRKKTRKF